VLALRLPDSAAEVLNLHDSLPQRREGRKEKPRNQKEKPLRSLRLCGREYYSGLPSNYF
jgi:hypothetical protein